MRVIPATILVQGLPAWNILLLARKPFAVALHDCSAIPAVLSSANAKVRSAATFSLYSHAFSTRDAVHCLAYLNGQHHN